jgi:hypothetical protein
MTLGNNLKVTKIIAEGLVGSSFPSVFRSAKKLADFFETLVIYEFNGIDIVISSNSDEKKVYDEYMQNFKRDCLCLN